MRVVKVPLNRPIEDIKNYPKQVKEEIYFDYVDLENCRNNEENPYENGQDNEISKVSEYEEVDDEPKQKNCQEENIYDNTSLDIPSRESWYSHPRYLFSKIRTMSFQKNSSP